MISLCLICIICLSVKDIASALLQTLCSHARAGEQHHCQYQHCPTVDAAVGWRKGLPRAAGTALHLGNVGSQDHRVIKAGRGLKRYNVLLWGKSLGHTCFVHQSTQNTHSSDHPGYHLAVVQHGVMPRQEKFSLRSGSKKASSPSISLRNPGFFLGGSVNLVHCGSDGNAFLLNTESLLLSLYLQCPYTFTSSALPLPNNKVFQLL